MQLTQLSSNEQTLLDIMEMRGFKVHAFNDHPWELETPDRYCYIISRNASLSNVEIAFEMFKQVNHKYP